jgi:hypothetical protein
MRFDVQIDPSALTARTLREAKNLVYSTSQALNAVAKDVQTAERVHLDRTYHLRKAGFMYRLIKIFQFSNARQGIPFVEIGVDAKTRVLLGIFETGGERQPFKGKHVAVPITGGEARPSEMSTIPAEFTFQQMKFKKHVTATGKTQWKGENGTFLIPNVGVFQRTAHLSKTSRRGNRAKTPGSGNRQRSRMVTLLYKLMAPSAITRLPANLQFVSIAAQNLQAKFATYFTTFYNRFH